MCGGGENVREVHRYVDAGFSMPRAIDVPE
jgi:hypothetical protein